MEGGEYINVAEYGGHDNFGITTSSASHGSRLAYSHLNRPSMRELGCSIGLFRFVSFMWYNVDKGQRKANRDNMLKVQKREAFSKLQCDIIHSNSKG